MLAITMVRKSSPVSKLEPRTRFWVGVLFMSVESLESQLYWNLNLKYAKIIFADHSVCNKGFKRRFFVIRLFVRELNFEFNQQLRDVKCIKKALKL